MSTEIIRNFGLILFVMMTISLLTALILFIVVVRRLQRLDVPPQAGFGETLALHTIFVSRIH